MRIGIFTVLLNLTLNIFFILTLPTYWKHAGMAFSTVIAEAVGMIALGSAMIALGAVLRQRVKNIQWLKIMKSFIRCLLSALIMATIVWVTARIALPFLKSLLPEKAAQISTIILAMGIGSGGYFTLALLLRAPELREIKTAISKK